MRGLIFILAATVITSGSFIACKSKKVSAKNDREIVFGCGGGFTGRGEYFTLKEDGNLYKGENETADSNLIKKISPKTSDSIFKQAFSPEQLIIEYNRPGNMSCSIVLRQKGEFVKSFVWVYQDENIPERIKDLYGKLQTISN